MVEPRTGLSMGESCELMVKHWHIDREPQDRLAFESHVKAAAAWHEGFYDELVIPFAGLKTDNNVRADASLAKLATLKPVFDRSSAGTLTAGNSTPADRWGFRAAAGLRAVGCCSQASGTRVASRRQELGGGFCNGS